MGDGVVMIGGVHIARPPRCQLHSPARLTHCDRLPRCPRTGKVPLCRGNAVHRSLLMRRGRCCGSVAAVSIRRPRHSRAAIQRRHCKRRHTEERQPNAITLLRKCQLRKEASYLPSQVRRIESTFVGAGHKEVAARHTGDSGLKSR